MDRKSERWMAAIRDASGKRKQAFLGYHDIEEDGALAYDCAARYLYGRCVCMDSV